MDRDPDPTINDVTELDGDPPDEDKTAEPKNDVVDEPAAPEGQP